MMKIPEPVIEFLRGQNFVVVSSLDGSGAVHNSCKGIVRIEPEGRIYLLDLYLRRTFANLRRDGRISLTAVNEQGFSGYCLKGRARISGRDEVAAEIVREWDAQITARISQRLVKNLRGEKGHSGHPEAKLPAPRYIISMEVEEIVNLAPDHLK